MPEDELPKQSLTEACDMTSHARSPPFPTTSSPTFPSHPTTPLRSLNTSHIPLTQTEGSSLEPAHTGSTNPSFSSHRRRLLPRHPLQNDTVLFCLFPSFLFSVCGFCVYTLAVRHGHLLLRQDGGLRTERLEAQVRSFVPVCTGWSCSVRRGIEEVRFVQEPLKREIVFQVCRIGGVVLCWLCLPLGC